MKTLILNLAQYKNASIEKIDSSLSFKPFVEYLEQRVKEEKTIKSKFYGFVLDRLRQALQTESTISAENITDYNDTFQLIYIMLTRIIDDEKEKLWALSYPLAPVIFYGTESLYNIMYEAKSKKIKIPLSEKETEGEEDFHREMIYGFILKKLFGCKEAMGSELTHSVIDEETGIQKYYKISFDTRFINVHAKEALPELNPEKLKYYLSEKDKIDELRKIMPVSMFRFEGISVLSFTDVTPQYAIENIKNTIINKASHTSASYYHNIIQSLKALSGNNDIEFGLLPVLKVNNKLVFDEQTCPHSILVETARRYGVAEKMYMSMADNYFKTPKLLFFESITEEDESRQVFLKALKQDGILSYCLMPVNYNNHLAGVLEVHAKKQGILNTGILAKLEPAMPFIAQLLQNNMDEFHANIETVIKEKFTSLQLSVQWKFKEAAMHYIQQSHLQQKKPETEAIIFRKVYPLYGAIDIRNSSIERNNATRDDLQYQLTLLFDVFEALKKNYPFALIDEMEYKIKKWKTNLQDAPTPSEEFKLNNFFDNEAMPFLEHIKLIHPVSADIINAYTESLNEDTGKSHENRRNLEASMQLINRTINAYLDQMNAELQKSYPFYFEKFRTDGIEYDIYIGQSMAPDKPFDGIYLKNLRLWQLQSMATIYRMVLGLQPQMQKELHITQLIFINADTIDISFRNDEKKFDVEGGYNIRYQMIKKRIDKVHVKDNGERLTQPGKIALIYFNSKEAEEYKGYIQYLQEQNIFTHEMEELELEELQGVSGLKALRVSVSVD